MNHGQLQGLVASFEAASHRKDGDRMQVWLTQDETGEVCRALQARIAGTQTLGVLPAGTKVIDICTTPFGFFLATEQGVYRFNDQHNKFEPVELVAGPLPLMQRTDGVLKL